jgi:hypothetical protein
MSFDELQQQWKDEPSGNVQIPTEMDVLKKAQTPIDAVRKKMKTDFQSQIFGLFIYGLYPLIFEFSSPIKFFYYIVYIIAAFLSVYFYYIFWGFYKQAYDLTYESRKNLYWFYYELRLNLILYKTLSYVGFLLLFAFLLLVFSWGSYSKDFTNYFKEINNFKNQIIAIGVLVVAIPFSIIVTELWTKNLYGKHLEKIKSVLDELDEL